jgi:hypothetical protein
MLRSAPMAKQGEGKKGDEERVFVKDGFRSFRRTYKVSEVYWGASTGAVLLGLVGWVTWKGAHPDPSLFDMSAALEGGAPPENLTGVDSTERRAGQRLGAPRASAEAATSASTAEKAIERGPLPPGLGAGAYREGKLGAFSADDMYVKINGRAGYFQAFGAKSLHTLTLEGPESDGAPSSVDIEAYDLAESRNAIGAYNGERPPGIESTVEPGSTFHLDRNAAFLARGRYYIRFIGSDESAPVVAELRRLLDVFRRAIPAEELPWAFAFFVDQLKLPASAVTYVKNNAFSFGFARDVYKASLSPADSKEDMEAFVVALADAEAAQATVAQYTEGFGSMGKAAGQGPGGAKWVEDEFLATFSGASAVERWVVGVRGAPSLTRAKAELARLRQGIAALPEAMRARAVPSPAGDEPGGEYGAADPAVNPGVTPGAGAPDRAAGTPPAQDAPPSGADDEQAAPGKPAEEGTDEY